MRNWTLRLYLHLKSGTYTKQFTVKPKAGHQNYVPCRIYAQMAGWIQWCPSDQWKNSIAQYNLLPGGTKPLPEDGETTKFKTTFRLIAELTPVPWFRMEFWKLFTKSGHGSVVSHMNSTDSWTYGWPSRPDWKCPPAKVPEAGILDNYQELQLVLRRWNWYHGIRRLWAQRGSCFCSYHGILSPIRHAKNGNQNHTECRNRFSGIYAMEWTADKIDGYVDGVKYFTFNNDKTNNKHLWRFQCSFLSETQSWPGGGNWGGAQGIDASQNFLRSMR